LEAYFSTFRDKLSGFSGMGSSIADKADAEHLHFFACSYDYWTDKSFGDCRFYKTAVLFGKPVPDFFTLAPSTLLKRF
jgi:hypothetical protein